MIKGYQGDILRIYENIRDEETLALRLRREEIEERIPEVMKLENQIGKLSLEMSFSILKAIDAREEYTKNIKDRITELRIRKSELLVSKGYDMDYLSLKYRCAKCKDTGFIGPERCSCYKQKLIDLYYKNSDLKDMLKKYNFDNYDLNAFSGRKQGDEPQSAKKNMERITSASWSFVNNFDAHKDKLFFYGTAGTGKTFLSCCIAKELLDKGYFVVYRTSEELISNLRRIRFENDKNLEEILIDCDLLIIDDLGSEQINDFSKTEFFNLLNKKLLSGKKMLISTNCTLEDLMKSYSERITSRLFGEFTIFKFYGDDLRVKKNFKVSALT